jgi:hypothetical protein
MTVGKRVGEWVYELFITTLPIDGFLVEDVLDLYHGRGAFEAVLADEDIEEDPDRWCSYTECGQEPNIRRMTLIPAVFSTATSCKAHCICFSASFQASSNSACAISSCGSRPESERVDSMSPGPSSG